MSFLRARGHNQFVVIWGIMVIRGHRFILKQNIVAVAQLVLLHSNYVVRNK